MSAFPSHINLLDKTPPIIDLVAQANSDAAEQKRKDEEFLLLRKAQIAREFNKDIDQVGALTRVATVGGIINNMRREAFHSKTTNSNEP